MMLSFTWFLHADTLPIAPGLVGDCTGKLPNDRKEHLDFESHRENLLASGSQKKQSFFSERNCDISVLSHQRGSPQIVTRIVSNSGKQSAAPV